MYTALFYYMFDLMNEIISLVFVYLNVNMSDQQRCNIILKTESRAICTWHTFFHMKKCSTEYFAPLLSRRSKSLLPLSLPADNSTHGLTHNT